MNKKNILWLLSLCLIPTVVLAESDASQIIGLMFMEAFITIHMTFIVLIPLSKIFGQENHKSLFWKLFWIRVGVLLFFDFFITPFIAVFDFLFVFVGGCIIVPICSAITKKNPNRVTNYAIDQENANFTVTSNVKSYSGLIIKCKNCGNELDVNDKFCTKCGKPFSDDNIEVVEDKKTERVFVTPLNYDRLYVYNEDLIVERFIGKKMDDCGVDKKTTLIPKNALFKKNVLNFIFAILLCLYISLIFFHFPLLTYIIGAIILFIFYKCSNKYTLMKYLIKQVKARPQEKVSNIIMEVKDSLVKDSSKNVFIGSVVLALVIPCIVFFTPKILYEEKDNGYAVRFYAFGLTNFMSASIPEEYNGKPVISLRGNTFSNMPFLTSVELPDTIIEIRGQAFKNDYNLVTFNIPKNLEYLGGGAFYNCKKITSVELPDTLNYMGGETFYKATKLEKVKLSESLTEIRGSSFEECVSLKEITIPDSVTRIGGHAFYHNKSLEKVNISENSQLREIGSSAFRLCEKLSEIYLPAETIKDERSFKESPTIVHRYGEINYGTLIDSKLYTYKDYLTLNLGDRKIINNTNSYANVYLAYLDYINASKQYGDYVFTLRYSDGEDFSYDFSLSKNKPFVIISDNIAIEVYSEYTLNSVSDISLIIYYN